MKRKQVMILFMTVLLLTGCGKDIKLTTGLAKNEIFKIQGETEELAEMTLVLVNEKNSYENSLGQDIWNRTFDGISLEDEIKEKVKKQLIELFVINQMAKKDGMTLSDGDKEQIAQAADTYFAQIPDEEQKKLGITRDTVYHFYEKLCLTDLYYEKKTKDEGQEISDEAERFGRPVICFVDTPGAFCGIEAEERGQGEAIARNLYEMSGLKVPVLTIVIGEGGSGGALAMAVSNEVYMMENATYSILSPEGFASILWKDSKRAGEASEVMKITAGDLLKLKVIEKIIPEVKPAGEENVQDIVRYMRCYIKEFLAKYRTKETESIVNERYERFRNF